MKQKCRMGRGKIPAPVLVMTAFSCLVHSALDVLPSVHPRELEFQAVAMATLAYILAQEGI